MNEPVRLAKVEDKPKRDYEKIFWDIVERNAHRILIAGIILAFLLFIIVCFQIVGLSATDSGAVYNNMDKII